MSDSLLKCMADLYIFFFTLEPIEMRSGMEQLNEIHHIPDPIPSEKVAILIVAIIYCQPLGTLLLVKSWVRYDEHWDIARIILQGNVHRLPIHSSLDWTFIKTTIKWTLRPFSLKCLLNASNTGCDCEGILPISLMTTRIHVLLVVCSEKEVKWIGW